MKKIIFSLIFLLVLAGCIPKYERVNIYHDNYSINTSFECVVNGEAVEKCSYEFTGCSDALEYILCVEERKPLYRIICSDEYYKNINDICVRGVNSCLAHFSINGRTDCRNVDNNLDDFVVR